jgi:hypothetical protein
MLGPAQAAKKAELAAVQLCVSCWLLADVAESMTLFQSDFQLEYRTRYKPSAARQRLLGSVGFVAVLGGVELCLEY